MTAELTAQEADLANLLGEVWNRYIELPVQHPMERDEFCRAVHACQDIVLARCGQRALRKAAAP